MRERELMQYIEGITRGAGRPWLHLGVGDDAAIVEPPGGSPLVLTTDTVVEGVHFESGTPVEAVGYKAVARALSDLAAMASRPLCTLAAVYLGEEADGETAKGLVRALAAAAEELSAPLVGGDVSAGPGLLYITVSAVGTPGPGGTVRRSGARSGDSVCVTGELGGSGRGRHLTFRPRIEEALALAGEYDVHAMIDVSDGLSTDALHLADASGVGLVLREADVPVAQSAVSMAGESGRSPIWHALNDGEDYELLFCLPPADAARAAVEGVGELTVSRIGEAEDGPESWLIGRDGERRPLLAEGWEYEV
jgi:thiamine-monophosphate kinase